MSEGDIVSMPTGSKPLFVLQPGQDPKANKAQPEQLKRVYRLVGECYILELLGGEAWRKESIFPTGHIVLV